MCNIKNGLRAAYLPNKAKFLWGHNVYRSYDVDMKSLKQMRITIFVLCIVMRPIVSRDSFMQTPIMYQVEY